MSPTPRRKRGKSDAPDEAPQPEPSRTEADAPEEAPEPSPSEDKAQESEPEDPSLLDRSATGSVAEVTGLRGGGKARPSIALEDAGGPAMGAEEIGDLPLDLDVEGSAVDKALVYAKGIAAFLAAFILPLAAYRPDLEDEGQLALALAAAAVAGLLVVRVRNRPKL